MENKTLNRETQLWILISIVLLVTVLLVVIIQQQNQISDLEDANDRLYTRNQCEFNTKAVWPYYDRFFDNVERSVYRNYNK